MGLQVSGAMKKDALVIRVEGRIDSTNAPELEKEVFSLCQQYPCEKVVLDAEKLEFISSAGLRVMLKLKKANKDFAIINVSNDVFEIFDMTGFTDMMTIRRRLRQFSVEGCKLIGQGGCGKVYRYDPETIIKVYRPELELESIKRERECSRLAFTRGLPTAIAFDLVRVGDSYGVMYELMDADNLASTMLHHPEQEDSYIRKYADLARQMHHTAEKPNTLPPSSDMFRSTESYLRKWLTEEEIRRYDAMVDLIPPRNTMIHGDYHEKNLLVRHGELEMIDMGDISQGHPMVELGCVYCTHAVFSEQVIGMKREKAMEIWQKFCDCYFGEMPEAVKPSFERTLKWLAALRRLPFLCMSPLSTKELIDSVKAEIFVDAEQIKQDFAVLDATLFPALD
ncbi:MAG: anti-sigma factor antagonist [Aristaeellaceae bacterium]